VAWKVFKKEGHYLVFIELWLYFASVHSKIEIVIKKGRGIRPYEALATLGLS